MQLKKVKLNKKLLKMATNGKSGDNRRQEQLEDAPK